MSKFIAFLLRMLLIALVMHLLTVDNSVASKKNNRNSRMLNKFTQEKRAGDGFERDVVDLFESGGNRHNKSKRNLSRLADLKAKKRRIQQLLKVKSFLESLDRHVRSARLKHYAEYIKSGGPPKKSSECASCKFAENATQTLSNFARNLTETTTRRPVGETETTASFAPTPSSPMPVNQAAWPRSASYLDLQNPTVSLGDYGKYVQWVRLNGPQNIYWSNQESPIEQKAPVLQNYENVNVPESQVPLPYVNTFPYYPISIRYGPANEPSIVDDYTKREAPKLREVTTDVSHDPSTKVATDVQNVTATQEPSSSPSSTFSLIADSTLADSAIFPNFSNSNDTTLNCTDTNDTNSSDTNWNNTNSSSSNLNSTIPIANVTSESPMEPFKKMMEEVLEGVEELKTGKAGMLKEDLPCEINGKWFSTAGGLNLNLCADNQTNVHISAYETTPKAEHGFMLEDKYLFDGIVPFPRSGMILINAVAQEHKTIATFIGQCLICNGAETIVGQWLTTRKAKNCIDLKASQEIIGDVMVKERLSGSRDKRYELHANDSKVSD